MNEEQNMPDRSTIDGLHGKPSPGKSHLLRHSQLAAGVPGAMVSHTKGHADVVEVLVLSIMGRRWKDTSEPANL